MSKYKGDNMNNRQTLEDLYQYINRIDQILEKTFDVTTDDLRDHDYASLMIDGITPGKAARLVLVEEGLVH